MALTKKRKAKESIAEPIVVEKQVVKPEYVYIKDYSYQVNVSSTNMTLGKMNVNYSLNPSSTGCGLYLFHGFTATPVDILENPVVLEYFRERFKTDMKVRQHYFCALATLGDNYKKYIPFLQALGFKEVLNYGNKLHGQNYKQGIWTLNVADL